MPDDSGPYLVALAEAHDRAFAEGALDLTERDVERLSLVHAVGFLDKPEILGHPSLLISQRRSPFKQPANPVVDARRPE